VLIRRILSVLAVAVAVGATAIVAQAPAVADPPPSGGGNCGAFTCGVWGNVPGAPGGGGNGGGAGGGGGGGAGCTWQGQTVPCDGGALGTFNNGDGCYYRPYPGSLPPPAGATSGAWYMQSCGVFGSGGVLGSPVWLTNPPSGPTPEQLAQQAYAKITLKGAQIGIAPDTNGAGLVGMPVWMWTTVSPQTWGPVTASESAGALTVTITGRAKNITWAMGDGTTVTCTSPGTPFKAGNGGQRSPDCGHVYTAPSRTKPGGRYTVVATTAWEVTWVGGGRSGVINTTRTSQTTVQIDELQVVTR